MAALIMVVEDEPNIGALVRTYLARDGYEVLWVRSGEDALAELPRHAVTLVVLDIGLPGIDGFEVCRRIGGRVPVIMLTARDEVADRVAGLELGADDYIPKPFSPRELTARIKAVLRRAGGGASADDVTTLGPVTLARGSREVRVDGQRGRADSARVRPARIPASPRRPGRQPRRAARGGVGVRLPRADPDGGGPRGAAAQEARRP